MYEKHEYEKERAEFRSLLLANPNYFGTAKESPFKPVVEIKANTRYEEIGCVGLDPKRELLEAVVYVKQPFGYGGGICSNGTPEFVRFYLSFDNGATWVDQGMTSFTAYDIPEGTAGEKRLEYAVSLRIDAPNKLCRFADDILARAILSWNDPPDPNDPDFTPVWGDVHDTHILPESLRLIRIPDLFKAFEIDVPKPLLASVDAAQEIQAAPPKELTLKELAAAYRDKDVEPHRFAFPEVKRLLAQSGDASVKTLLAQSPLSEIDVDVQDLVAKLEPGDGNTSYEELECVGLNPNQDALVGVLRIKRPAGYHGGPCTKGSVEYVTFWADFNNNGTYETCLGTATVNVYDFDDIPKEGLEYAVTLPVDLKHHRQPCEKGPTVVPIRATLSWQQPPPCWNPNFVPVWGNREETLIHIAPGPSIPVGTVVPLISILGGIPVSMIHNITGLTTSNAVFALNGLKPDAAGRPCPFGGRIVAQGPQYVGYKYRVQVRRVGDPAWSTVTTPLKVTDLFGNVSTHAPDGSGLFTYLPFTQNIANVLAWWNSSGDDRWEVRLQVFTLGGVLLPGADVHRAQLDNTAPEVDVEITSGSGNCGKFHVGDTLSGDFVARDLYFGSYSLHVKPPINPAGIGVPSPSSGTTQTAAAPGDPWTLNTAGMKACGYIIEVVARDRAILNSASVGHWRSASEGFCLED